MRHRRSRFSSSLLLFAGLPLSARFSGATATGVDKDAIDKLVGERIAALPKKLVVDGKEYDEASVRALLGKQNELAEVIADLRMTYDPDNADPEKTKVSLTKTLKRAGWDDARVKAEIDRAFSAADPDSDDDGDEPAAKTGKKGADLDEGKPPKWAQDLLDTNNKKIAADLDASRKLHRQAINRDIARLAAQALASKPYQEIIDGFRRRDGAEAAKDITTELERRLTREIGARLDAKIKETNEFSLEYLDNVAPDAVKSVRDNVVKFSGDPRRMGIIMSAEQLAGENAMQRIAEAKEPAPAPKYEPGKSIGDIKEAAITRMTDTIVRNAVARSKDVA